MTSTAADIELSDNIDEIVEQIDAFIAEEELGEAETLVKRALEKHPEAHELHASHAEIALENDDYQGTFDIVENIIETIDEEEGELRGLMLNLQAHACFYMDDFDQARHLFNQSLREDFEVWSALLGRAKTHERMGFLVASLIDLDHAIQLDDQEAEPFAIRGRIYLRRGAMEEALRDFGYALDSDPFDEETRLTYARMIALNGATSDAIEVLEFLLEEGESEDVVATGALLRSQLSLMLGSTEAASEDAELAIEKWPDHPWGYLQLAACQLTAMNPDAALKTLKEADRRVTNTKDVPDIHALRATAYEQLEKHEKAERERGKAEGSARLPMIVYGPLLNPAANTPVNPENPIDIRAIMADLFGHPDAAPDGYEEALREVVDKIPEIIAENPDVERIHIELPEVDGMVGEQRNLVIQVNREQEEEAEA